MRPIKFQIIWILKWKHINVIDTCLAELYLINKFIFQLNEGTFFNFSIFGIRDISKKQMLNPIKNKLVLVIKNNFTFIKITWSPISFLNLDSNILVLLFNKLNFMESDNLFTNNLIFFVQLVLLDQV